MKTQKSQEYTKNLTGFFSANNERYTDKDHNTYLVKGNILFFANNFHISRLNLFKI